MRKRPTPAERRLWNELRGRGCAGMKFRRQSPILGWLVDFYCPASHLAVEVDGAYHDNPNQAAQDAYRDRAMAAAGVTVLRFTNEQVLSDAAAVLAKISEFRRSNPASSPAPLTESLVTVGTRAGRGGIRAVVPSATTSGDTDVPADVPSARYPGNIAVNDAIAPGDFGVGTASL